MQKLTAATLLLVTTLLSATSQAYSLSGSSAAGNSATSESARHSGAKSIHQPTGTAEAAPVLEWVDPSAKPRVVLLCIHGLGLHKGNYEAFGKNMCKYGIPTYAIDVRGFGTYLGSGRHRELDFEGTLADIKLFLEQLHQKYPDVPVVILGESMGGAIALRATALYPELVSGLVSSVPSGDRFNQFGQNIKVGVAAIVGGFNKPMNIGETIVRQATQKEGLRKEWSEDPMGKMKISPAELIRFNKFMAENFEAAHKITDKPVLFVQGVSDKLVRPAGTWKLCDSLATPNREIVLSKTGEHLIFEEAQFSDNDLLFLRKWINANVAKLDPSALPIAAGESETSATTNGADGAGSGQVDAGAGTTPAVDGAPGTGSEVLATAGSTPQPPVVAAAASPATASIDQTGATPQGISYWIELIRAGKMYRCNNKTHFKSGDAIRFHVTPDADGYVYVVMKEGSSGKRSILFPSKETGSGNFLRAGQDYPLPYQTWLQFDKHPGIEKVSLLISRSHMDPEPQLNNNRVLTAYVSPETSGAKDLVPTRMKLSWDDPAPVIIPGDRPQLARAQSGSAVRISYSGNADVLAIDVALAHD